MKITEVKVWLVEGVKYNWTLMKVHMVAEHMLSGNIGTFVGGQANQDRWGTRGIYLLAYSQAQK
jgi:hypothetical protein